MTNGPPVTLPLSYLRERTGLRQEDLAFRMGVHRITVLRWENGQTKPSSDQVKRLASIFQVPTWLILDSLENADQEIAVDSTAS